MVIYNLHKDFDYYINKSLDIVFVLKGNPKRKYTFSTLLSKNKNLKVPDKEVEIQQLLSGQIDFLPQAKVDTFLKLMEINLLYFAVALAEKTKSDIMLYNKIIIVNIKQDKRYLYLSDTYIPSDIMDRFYAGSKNGCFDAAYAQAAEDLITYIGNKVNHNIKVNTSLSEYIRKIKPLQAKLSAEFGRPRPDIISIFNYYEQILKIKSEYYLNEHVVLTEEEIKEIYDAFEIIKDLMDSCTRIKIGRVN